MTAEFVCPNDRCAFEGRARRQWTGHARVSPLLCCLLLIPGIILFWLSRTFRYYCPRCGILLGEDL
jgi:predicted RNA-binding Zn-ribbon protein involved in translation (DUF1610 family)